MQQALGGMLFGALADRVRPRRLIASGYVVEGVAALALATIVMPVGVSLAIIVRGRDRCAPDRLEGRFSRTSSTRRSACSRWV